MAISNMANELERLKEENVRIMHFHYDPLASIPKQVIIDKMKKYELAIKSYDSSIANYKQSQDVGKFIVLKELLEEQ